MAILDSKTRVTFVTNKDTKKKIDKLVEIERRNGRKVTTSSYIDDVLSQHIAMLELFTGGTE